MSTTPRERPIMFSGPMVRAILGGRKTQTRRVVKPQPAHGCRFEMNAIGGAALHLSGEWGRDPSEVVFVPPTPTSKDHRIFCPYGQPGDRLWVRETWKTCDGIYVPGVEFTDGSRAFPEFDDLHAMPSDHQDYSRKRSPIHMPRWASRITLAITRVRVERVQDITEADAIEEGVGPGYVPNASGSTSCVGHRPMFARLWNEINAPRGHGWASNPWIWVIDFERINMNASEP